MFETGLSGVCEGKEERPFEVLLNRNAFLRGGEVSGRQISLRPGGAAGSAERILTIRLSPSVGACTASASLADLSKGGSGDGCGL